MARLFIVRHGNTFDRGQTVTRVGGRTDLPLSVSGSEQAGRLSEKLRGQRFTAAVCSPLLRTRQTARIILSGRRDAPPLLIEPFLREIDYGPDENRPETEVVERLGPALEAWEKSGTPPPGWHADPDRIRLGWRGLLERAATLAAADAVLIVTSNGIARFLPDLADSAPPGLERKLATGAWGEILVAGGARHILSWNERP